MREHEDQVRLLIRRNAGCGGAGGCSIDVRLRRKAGDDDVGDLIDENQTDRPTRQFGCLAESLAFPVEARPPPVARPTEDGDQDRCLHNHAGRRADPQKQHLTGGQCSIRSFRDARDDDEQHEGRDGDDVVRYRCEHRRPEGAASVQDLTQHRVGAVEEDLRKTQTREGDGEVVLALRVIRGCVEIDDPWSSDHGENG